jgi:hypothetical protein
MVFCRSTRTTSASDRRKARAATTPPTPPLATIHLGLVVSAGPGVAFLPLETTGLVIDERKSPIC